MGWKLLWLGAVALPLSLDNQLHGATRDQVGEVLWVVLVILVIPWAMFSTSTCWHQASPGVDAGKHTSPRRGARDVS